MKTADHVIRLTTDTYNVLAACHDLSPNNPKVNDCLKRFVSELVMAEQGPIEKSHVLNDSRINEMRPALLKLLSRAECEMEHYFASEFLKRDTLSLKDLDSFWYNANYQALVAQELKGMAEFDISLDKPVAFVGAGPLPLSAVGYVLATGQPCVCVDNDRAAAKEGQALIDKLGLGHAIQFAVADGAKLDYAPYGLVMVASLVGKKDDVLRRIQETAPDAVTGVRSADGLMTLLYEPVDVADIVARGFVHQGTAFASAKTINSTCFFRQNPGFAAAC